MLEVNDLAVSYGHIEALEHIDLNVGTGEIVSVLGANGAGKSTLLRAVSGLIRPKRGRISFEGEALQSASAAEIVRRGVVHVLEGRGMLTELTVMENLRIGAYCRKDAAGIRADTEWIFEIFPVLKRRATQTAGLLSGGEQQMLAIARALLSKPKLVMIDEMSLGLAPMLVQNILGVIGTIAKAGTSFLLVEQNAKLALGYSDRAYVLRHGKVVLSGSSKEILTDGQLLRSYLG